MNETTAGKVEDYVLVVAMGIILILLVIVFGGIAGTLVALAAQRWGWLGVLACFVGPIALAKVAHLVGSAFVKSWDQ